MLEDLRVAMSAMELFSNPFFDLSWILKYLLYPSNQADHPLVEERDRQGLLTGTAPLFRPTVFISMVTSELQSAGFLFTTVMEFSFQ